MTDTVADFLTRIRNAVKANHRIVEIPASNLKKEMTKILKEKGYIPTFQGIKMDIFVQSYRKMKIGMTPQGMLTRCKLIETTSLCDKFAMQ